jgi:hypothetical protein
MPLATASTVNGSRVVARVVAVLGDIDHAGDLSEPVVEARPPLEGWVNYGLDGVQLAWTAEPVAAVHLSPEEGR